MARGVPGTRLLVGSRFAGGAALCWRDGPLLVERNLLGKLLNSACDSMRSGGISDEDTLNRPLPFTLVVNNHVESES